MVQVVQPSTWLVTKKFFALRLPLTTTRSTGASRGGDGGGGARSTDTATFIATNPVFGKIARRAPALHRCHERHHVPHHSIYRVRAAAYAAIAERNPVSRSSSLDSRQPRHSLCPLKLARKCLSRVRRNLADIWSRQSPPTKAPLFMGSSGVLFYLPPVRRR